MTVPPMLRCDRPIGVTIRCPSDWWGERWEDVTCCRLPHPPEVKCKWIDADGEVRTTTPEGVNA